MQPIPIVIALQSAILAESSGFVPLHREVAALA